ncbi:hypothetical protein FSEG_02119 [Fusobacterium necrophorum D12]|uniref:opine metallophore biosynthesis dehydrogenase n=1 Tax=Fusobacterium necrophorum TaxID=859 RepID=UPI000219BEA9|nr:opine metallophore biosynthesis dehydrogenase [Fusobacterium necrophorum]EGR53939.1 hypothetical protein FSEG_02119 [Fusobacterium necrophorum D12]
MKENTKINNVLIFGNGPVALHLYISLKKQGSNKVGIKVRDSLKAKNFLKELREEKFVLEGQIQTELPSVAYGKVYVENLIQENEEILNEWENFILATPCDAYLSILENIPLISLKSLKTIILVSPELGSAYFFEKIG